METAEAVAKTILRNDQASVRSAKQVTLDMIAATSTTNSTRRPTLATL
jgi:hypothetical protein